MKRAIAVLVIGAAFGAALVSPVKAQASNAYVASEETFEAPDGTELYAQVFRPAHLDPDDKTPVILVITPYQSFLTLSAAPTLLYRELEEPMRVFSNEYTVVQASLRGYGHSEGCGDFGGPGEQMDAKAAVEWAATQPWSTGKVGTYGISYDAWTQVMALAGKAKLSAAIVSSPLISAYRGLFMNRVHYATGWHATPGLYGVIDLTSPGAPDQSSPTCYPTNTYETAQAEPDTDYWKARDLVKRARTSDVPTFWTFGFMDPQTKPDNFYDIYGSLEDEKRAWFGQWIHRIPMPEVGNMAFSVEAMRFFDEHLKGIRTKDPAVAIQEGSAGVWRNEAVWPPADSNYVTLPVKPGGYVDSSSDDDGPGSERGTWTFSQKLPYDVHLSGIGKVDLRIDSSFAGVHVHARLFDVSDTSAKLITRGAMEVIGEGAITDGLAEERVRFDFYPQDWRIPKGHRIGLLLSGADNAWFDPGITNASVTVSGAFKIPFLRIARTRSIRDTKPSSDMGGATILSLTGEVISERAVRMPLPPRMR